MTANSTVVTRDSRITAIAPGAGKLFSVGEIADINTLAEVG